MSPAQYRPEIDGLRAVAVLAVVFFHLPLGCPGGFVGVDVFFVISGYLITRLILHDLALERFSLPAFWDRRVRRLMPALAFMLAGCVLIGWLLLTPGDFVAFGDQLIAQALGVSNVYFWRVQDYFADRADLQPLLHTWSLGVEEQFYLLYPLLLLGVLRLRGRPLRLVTAGLLLASLVLALVIAPRKASAAFYLLPTRAWELALGALLAWPHGLDRWSRGWREFFSVVGLSAIAFSVLEFGAETSSPWPVQVVPCVGAALLIATASGTLVGQCLSWRPVRFVGLVSYSLYLWHWPVLLAAKYGHIGVYTVAQRLGLAIAALALATFSWRYVERPFRERGLLPSRRGLFWAWGALVCVCVAFGASVKFFDGYLFRCDSRVRRMRQDFVARPREFPQASLAQVRDGELTRIGPEGKVTFLLWGDSHGLAICPGLASWATRRGVGGAAAVRVANPPLFNFSAGSRDSLGNAAPAYAEAVVDYAKREHVRDVVLVCRWSRYTGIVEELLPPTVGRLQAAGLRVWIVKEVPDQRLDLGRNLSRRALLGGSDDVLPGVTLAEHREATAPFERLIPKLPGVRVLDPTPFLFGEDGVCRPVRRGEFLYRDSNHLTSYGARLLAPMFEPLLR